LIMSCKNIKPQCPWQIQPGTIAYCIANKNKD
jgi:hypothetical protein